MPKPITDILEIAIPIKDTDGNIVFVTPKQLQEQTAPAVAVAPAKSSKPAGSPDAKARFYIHSDDEQEVAAMNVPENAVPTEKLEQAANALVETFNLAINTEQKQKLAKIILSLLKDIRNPRKTREVLMREESLGGMGLAAAQAEDMIAQTQAKKKEIFNRIKGDRLAESLQPEQSETGVKDMFEETSPAPAVTRDTLLTEVKPRSTAPTTPSVDVPPAPAPAYTPTERSKPVGPVEEMKLLTLVDFRRLGKSATDSAQRVFQKIDLLADESLELKAQAIKAWKSSPAYQDYLAIGHRSMEGHESVEDIIKSKEVNDMTLEEFHAIADLNKSLQF